MVDGISPVFRGPIQGSPMGGGGGGGGRGGMYTDDAEHYLLIHHHQPQSSPLSQWSIAGNNNAPPPNIMVGGGGGTSALFYSTVCGAWWAHYASLVITRSHCLYGDGDVTVLIYLQLHQTVFCHLAKGLLRSRRARIKGSHHQAQKQNEFTTNHISRDANTLVKQSVVSDQQISSLRVT